MCNLRKIVVFLISLFVFFLKSSSQGAVIVLRDSAGRNISGAKIYFLSLHQEFSTDQHGLSLVNVKPGVYEILLEHSDYYPLIVHLAIPARDTVFFILKPRTKTLTTVVIQDQRVIAAEHKEVISHKDIRWKNTRDDLASSLAREAGIASARIGSENSRIIIRGLGLDRVKVQERDFGYVGHYWGLDHELEMDALMFQQTILHRGAGSILRGGGATYELLEVTPSLMVADSGIHLSYYTSYLSSNCAFKQGIQLAKKTKHLFIQMSGTFLRYAALKVPVDSFSYLGYRFPLVDHVVRNTAGIRGIVRLDAIYQRKKNIFLYVLEHYRNQMGFFAYAHGLPAVNYHSNFKQSRYKFDLPYHDVFFVKTYLKYVLAPIGRWSFFTLTGYQYNQRTEFSYPHSHGLPINEPLSNREVSLIIRNAQFKLGVERHGESLIFKSELVSELTTHDRAGYFYILPNYQLFHGGWTFGVGMFQHKFITLDLASSIDFYHLTTGNLINPWIQNPSFQFVIPTLKRNYFTFNGGVALNMFSKDKKDTLICFIGVGQRMPSAHELSMNGLHHNAFRHEMGNPSLKPELGFQWDLVYRKKIAQWKLAINPYVLFYTNYIYLSPSGIFSPLPEGGQLYVYRSTSAIKPGYEGKLSRTFKSFLTLHFTFDATYPYNIKDHYPLPFSPPLKFLGETDVKINSDFEVGMEIIHQFSQNWIDRNEKFTPGWTIINTRFLYEKKLKRGGTLTGMFLIANLTNRLYFDHLSYYRSLDISEPGREFRVQIIYRSKP